MRSSESARARSEQAGFSLMEVMIVMAVVGLMMATVIVGFGAGRAAEVSRATNQIANSIRYAYDKSRVTGEHFRLWMNLDEGTFAIQAADARMYLPATDRDGRLVQIDESKQRDREERDRRAAEMYNRSVQAQVYDQAAGDEGEADEQGAEEGGYNPLDPFAPTARAVPRRKPPIFQAFDDENALSGLAKPFSLPEGAKIVYVRTADDPKPITEGEASIYFFPRGTTQLAHIQIADDEGESEYTITLRPLTGKVEIEDGRIDLEIPSDRRDAEDELGKREERRSF